MAQLSFIDRLIGEVDKGLRTLNKAHHAKRDNPSSTNTLNDDALNSNEQALSARLMRVNHCGEVCAQALYQGQALTAKSRTTQDSMTQAAEEEIDHLVWCEERLEQLNSHTSVLNPIWYSLSFSLGAITGLLGDKVSLGFVAATEEQVCEHIKSHIAALPKNDTASRDILETMLKEEQAHGQHALSHGGTDFPKLVKLGMSAVSKVMTKTSAHI
ncbi:MAG: 2-polyprenyl-3-methyl-6-methoxy-1,4-benzoquinone monooxygenase [Pseudomonadota bacterium]